jgi:hypothetical protein
MFLFSHVGHQALFLEQCVSWTQKGLANALPWEAVEAGRWYLRGQEIGRRPLFSGLCSMCGSLLFDAGGGSLSNKATGPPCTRDGTIALRPDGTMNAEAPPPFLLRFSPALFAAELPAVFQHDPATNRLSLRPGVKEPWLRRRRGGSAASQQADSAAFAAKAWLFCIECKARYFPADGQRLHSHVTYRDKASQALLKPVRRNYQPTRGQKAPGADGEEASQGHKEGN